MHALRYGFEQRGPEPRAPGDATGPQQGRLLQHAGSIFTGNGCELEQAVMFERPKAKLSALFERGSPKVLLEAIRASILEYKPHTKRALFIGIMCTYVVFGAVILRHGPPFLYHMVCYILHSVFFPVV